MKVLISSGFGAGWSTWNDKRMAVDKDVIELFEKECTLKEMMLLCDKKGYEDVYYGGFDGLEVVEVPKGLHFKVVEYDGAESIEVMEQEDWFYAED